MTTPTPWWANDPRLAEIRRCTAEEFGIVLDETEPAETGDLDDSDDSHDSDDLDSSAEPTDPDYVMTELFDGRCRRELGEARDALAHARERFDAAVLAARDAGLSWAGIGHVLAVSKQQLHRRFGARQRGRR